MAIRTLSEKLDTLYTTTWQDMKGTVSDQVFDATPFWAWLKMKNKLITQSGGRFITQPLQYAKNDQVSWIGRGGRVSLVDFEFLTVANWDWRYQAGSIVRFGVDDQKNRSKHEIINQMTVKMANTQDSLVDDMETRLFQAIGSESTGFDGLQNIVADDPTAAVSIGNISQSTYSWWRNKTTDMTGESFAALGVDRMRTMLNNIGNNKRGELPDIIMSGQTPIERYESNVLDYLRITNKAMSDLGFDNVSFKGIPWVWSPACANSRIYMLNTKYIQFVYDPFMFFDMTEWKSIPDQPNDRAAQIVTACAVTTSRRRAQGVIFGQDTD